MIKKEHTVWTRSQLINIIKKFSYCFWKGTPLILDEVQRAPESFLSIKYMIASDRHPGMYMLTGSQKYDLMKNVNESLAGRISIMNMLGFSDRELYGEDFSEPFMPTIQYLKNRNSKISFSLPDLWKRIHKGSMPEMHTNQFVEWKLFYASYVSTYIDRDVRQLAQVGDTIAFTQFMIALAARTGELLNMSSLVRDVGKDHDAANQHAIRLLTPDRLGIGGSSAQANRTLLSRQHHLRGIG